jgi:signal transduction histidine kinase
MNLLSNALKFIKDAGKITIVTELIKAQPNRKKAKRKFVDFYQTYNSSELPSFLNSNIFSSISPNNEDVSENEYYNFEKEHGVEHIYIPDPIDDKIVITVIDNGIGIKKKDKLKLFKLFGCLQNTRQMNT